MNIRRRHRELDEKVKDARARAAAAQKEVEVSEERHEEIQQKVIIPLRKAAEHNQFAELLRASILAGHNGSAS